MSLTPAWAVQKDPVSKVLKVWLTYKHQFSMLASREEHASLKEKGAAYTITQHSSCKGGRGKSSRTARTLQQYLSKRKETQICGFPGLYFLHVVLYYTQGNKFLIPQDPKNGVALKDFSWHPPKCYSQFLMCFCSGVRLAVCAKPSMCSALLFLRDPNGFNDWTFSTVRCWGERARGIYRLAIRDVGEPSCLTLPCPP